MAHHCHFRAACPCGPLNSNVRALAREANASTCQSRFGSLQQVFAAQGRGSASACSMPAQARAGRPSAGGRRTIASPSHSPRRPAWAARPLAGSEPPAVRARFLSALPWLTALPENHASATLLHAGTTAKRRAKASRLAGRRLSPAPRGAERCGGTIRRGLGPSAP